MNAEEVERNLNYVFKDKTLLERALTLPSADISNNNQTFEFFGDAILEFLVSEKIFDENASEGSMTERRKTLVSDKALAPVSQKLGLDKALIRSKYDDNNRKAVPSVYEAVVAAVYLDGGIEAARKFVFSTLDFTKKIKTGNYKGELQEALQARGEACPKYGCENVGTAGQPLFKVSVTVSGKTFYGEAPNKRQAEQNAAFAATEYLKTLNAQRG